MELSRKAIISLRKAGAPAPKDWQPPSLAWLAGAWHITHSTLPYRTNQRNARIMLKIALDGRSYNSEASHQAVSSSFAAIEKTDAAETPLDAEVQFQGGPTAARFRSDGGDDATWEVLAWGKEGQLEDWMHVDAYGSIADSSGECRADWRNSYVVVYRTAPEDGVEIWDRWGRYKPLSDETIESIKAALRGVGEMAELADALVAVKADDGRD